MSDLEEIEAIKQLKYRYLRAVDLKLWDLLESTFAQNAVAAYDSGHNSFEGRDAIVSWLPMLPKLTLVGEKESKR